ncbi:hydroxymethylglutaryl-CoA reductase, degradative [Patiriisocius hiemis]|uniref:3-hydroxy-3-methylglutaryl coenzyme A reductase n=1 Tax=Patiriisocius hiemis TaxID=3075604 RepID=A0ABU2YDJ8_9FLAO|nr:hydroxymethylglutaryl-CoA reductase, degradative [Constantimarinum sp. W242]MDT0556267.1 hydroxymethylglutaryl-CoA reductase, degradative [Constantimarinum sp. W242]
MPKPVSGFSKKNKEEKIDWLLSNYLSHLPEAKNTLKKYWNADSELQKLHDDFIENTLSNYYLPFSIAPNFLINNTLYAIPMVIEESSVVAAASNAAKFWLDKGGFSAEVISTQKNGQIHINYYGDTKSLKNFFNEIKPLLIHAVDNIAENMKKRGGGLLDIELLDASQTLEGYYQLHCTFETLDAMGANFINSCLETIAKTFETEARKHSEFKYEVYPEVVMSILSNYVPECLVRAKVSCPVTQLSQGKIDGKTFAEKFVRAVNIAKSETRRAVTHNKGIMNGIDAVILATGNDFRAVEAGVHAYAAKNGYYSSLTHATIEDETFNFWIEIPLALGTVGGLTSLHPLVKLAFEILQKPNAKQLMQLVAVAGLAQNFAAIRSLVTTGIQKGHMKMHLMNILNQLGATEEEKRKTVQHFKDTTVSHTAVVNYLENIRNS